LVVVVAVVDGDTRVAVVYFDVAAVVDAAAADIVDDVVNSRNYGSRQYLHLHCIDP
jgi:hypothetical protein